MSDSSILLIIKNIIDKFNPIYFIEVINPLFYWSSISF